MMTDCSFHILRLGVFRNSPSKLCELTVFHHAFMIAHCAFQSAEVVVLVALVTSFERATTSQFIGRVKILKLQSLNIHAITWKWNKHNFSPYLKCVGTDYLKFNFLLFIDTINWCMVLFTVLVYSVYVQHQTLVQLPPMIKGNCEGEKVLQEKRK